MPSAPDSRHPVYDGEVVDIEGVLDDELGGYGDGRDRGGDHLVGVADLLDGLLEPAVVARIGESRTNTASPATGTGAAAPSRRPVSPSPIRLPWNGG